jgi:predicted aldo/keto reductase-like oxidoreductase
MKQGKDMLYRKFGKTGEMVSALGFGCMRLPIQSGGDLSAIDEERATELLHFAIDKGVNYIDTAYPYHSNSFPMAGESEPFVGRALSGGWRDRVKLATKLPPWNIRTASDMDRLLDEQLERLQTGFIDFYLVHNIHGQVWPMLKELNVGKFLDRALADGRIRHAGFSFHDRLELFKEAVDYHDWSFCQIQFNYLDEKFQAGREGMEYAEERGLGISVMEPLRGGSLAAGLPPHVKKIFEAADMKRSPAEWALRWIWNNPEVSVVLSGMNSMEQLRENLAVASDAAAGAMSPRELEVVGRARDMFRKNIQIDCTTCGYCMPCPNGVQIPSCFSMYNSYHLFEPKDEMSKRMYGIMLSPEQRASGCSQCGVCEPRCPQNIRIMEELKRVRAEME